jgi:hypothetical protein
MLKIRAKWTNALRSSLLGGGVALALGVGLVATVAYAAGYFTNGLPVAGGTQYPSTLPLTGNETIPADTNLTQGQNPASEAITVNQLASSVNGSGRLSNALIGGDATTNLFQRGTAGASQTTTVAYGGPDRFVYWSGTSTAMTLSQDTTAADLVTSYKAAFKMARTSGQTGVVPLCMAQEVESVNSYQFAGSTAEFDFHAIAGSAFTAANSAITAYIIYGTGQDEGTTKLAFGLNGGGGGSSGWTGQTNAAADVITIGTLSASSRYAAVANIPGTATEIAVALCFTPVGTGVTNDYVAFSGLQLVRNPSNGGYASATVGYGGLVPFSGAGFERRSQEVETALQQRYYFRFNETSQSSMTIGLAYTTTQTTYTVATPVQMRTSIPTAITLLGSMQTTNSIDVGILLTGISPSLSPSNANALTLIGAVGAGLNTGTASILVGSGGVGYIGANAEL